MVEIIGLVLNAVGAYLLAKSADIQGDMVAEIIERILPTHGRFDSVVFADEDKLRLANARKKSRICNRSGYVLFIIGLTILVVAMLTKEHA